MIVGSDSLIGRALYARFVEMGLAIMGTTRRSIPGESPLTYLDLAADIASWECPPAEVAVLCAGETAIGECRSKPEYTWRVNVEATSAVARKFLDQKTFVIYLSTNQVFDGSSARTKPDALVAPLTEYGRQKAEVERRLNGLSGTKAIVRLTKVLDRGYALFDKWVASLRQGTVVEPFNDMFLAPVPLSCVVSVLTLVATTRSPGIFQISGDRDVSYAQAALLCAKALDLKTDLIRPVCAAETGRYSGPIPRNTTLDSERLKVEFGFKPPEVEWTIRRSVCDPHVPV